MIKNITIKNIVTNKEIELGYEGSFIIEEIDWDSPVISHDTFRVPYQIGVSYLGTNVGIRKPSIIGYVVMPMEEQKRINKTNWKDYYKIQEEYIEKMKLELDKVISINQDVIITANGYTLYARPTQPPKYSKSFKENNEILCMFSLGFECFKPMFYFGEKYVELAVVREMFHFPLIISEDGVIFSEIERRKSILVNNESDVDCGCIIVIEAEGNEVINPKIYNVVTGEYLYFEGLTLNDGDILTVNTNIGEENAVVHRVETSKDESVVGTLSAGSEFLKIKQGSSYYAYDVESGENSINIYMKYSEEYFNIKGM